MFGGFPAKGTPSPYPPLRKINYFFTTFFKIFRLKLIYMPCNGFYIRWEFIWVFFYTFLKVTTFGQGWVGGGTIPKLDKSKKILAIL